ncbi:MAG: 3-keto-disaccharide hydrolase [Planctomycetota bacterium]
MRHRIVLVIVTLAYCLPLISRGEDQDFKNLFNGKDLAGWEYFLVKDDAQMKDVWSVEDGILICKGKPMGYLATKEKYKNFKLVVVWRWAPGKKPGNSGVLLRITGEPRMLPKCVEAQLKSGDAGDIWAFQGFQVKSDTDRFRKVSTASIGDFVGVEKKTGNEKPPGEWNKYEITLDGDELTLAVNGKMVNQCHGCDVVAGQIGLQSEGGEIHFKTVKLLPLDE